MACCFNGSFRVNLPETIDESSIKEIPATACLECVDEYWDCFLGFRPDNTESTSSHRASLLFKNRDESGNSG